jgi:hypothetical protein
MSSSDREQFLAEVKARLKCQLAEQSEELDVVIKAAAPFAKNFK